MDQENSDRISRRSVLKGLSFLACAVPATLMAGKGVSEAQGKVSKAKAEYQDKPMDGKKCADCVHFRPPNGCEGVEGEISPSGWCKLFKAKG